jgi:collagenase-like PrtC family protease
MEKIAMKLSVPCTFEESLFAGLAPYPVYELYGKLTTDYFGGGRPSFYLPFVDEKKLEYFVRRTHDCGVEFNYLLNSSAMANLEFTRAGQREINRLLDWLDDIQVDSITVANLFFLKLIKKRYPRFKVRISSHRFTDSPRKVRFWREAGADYLVISEVSIHREFKILEAMRHSAGDELELQLIVNNWCRQNCAIAGNHAVGLSVGSQRNSKGFPLDFCSLYCNYLRLSEPVNYIRANWIRPEDLSIYESLGYTNFKIVERNTPTALIIDRVKAYHERRYEGNLLDLLQNYSYPFEKFSPAEQDAYSRKRLIRCFLKPRAINLIKFIKVIKFGKQTGVLFPRFSENPVFIDNRKLDGFLEFFRRSGCQEKKCDHCRYCDEWAQRVVKIDPAWRAQTMALLEDLLENIYTGEIWESHFETAKNCLFHQDNSVKKLSQEIRDFIKILDTMP